MHHEPREMPSSDRHVQRAVASPKRLLDLRGGAVVLREDPQHQKYACLSHCWGANASFVKTISATLNAFKTNIPWECLTATFRDAITICRRLGISFLWIDSLCIIQDSDEDWRDQAGRMADIYENAYLTLAATKSRDGSGGCFAETDAKYIAKLVPGYQHIFVRQEVPKFPSHWTDFEPPAGRHGEWPLLNRAWVYQEMRLSPRVLHFCAEEAVWVCRTAQRSESGCNDADFKYNAIYELSGSYSSTPYWLLQEKPRLLWYRTVEEYSRLQLTFELDKMPALAGLAQRVGSLRPGDRYIAGMWEKSLALDMLWRTGTLSGPGRSAVADCPSWSWARVKDRVNWDHKIDTVFASVTVRGIRTVSRGSRANFAEISPGTPVTMDAPAMDASSLLAEYYLNNSNAGVFGIPAGTQIPAKELLIIGYKIDNRHDQLDVSGYIIPLGFDAKEHLKFTGIHVRKIAGSETYERVAHAEISHPSMLRGEPDTRERMRPDRSEDGRKVREAIENLPTTTFVLV